VSAVPHTRTPSLAVKNLVARPLTLSVADLQRLSRTRTRVRHHCVEGWSAVSSWDGVRLEEIARLASTRGEVRGIPVLRLRYWSSWRASTHSLLAPSRVSSPASGSDRV
jgi:DMSO/TMAO reductase YedYZ molybdopterin-dependent catalytic subunit